MVAIIALSITALWFGVCGLMLFSALLRAGQTPGTWGASMMLEPRDLWVGLYWDPTDRPDSGAFKVFVCITPGVVFKFVRVPEGGGPDIETLERQRREHGRTSLGVPPPVPATHPETEIPSLTFRVPARKPPTPLPLPAPGRLYEFP